MTPAASGDGEIPGDLEDDEGLDDDDFDDEEDDFDDDEDDDDEEDDDFEDEDADDADEDDDDEDVADEDDDDDDDDDEEVDVADELDDENDEDDEDGYEAGDVNSLDAAEYEAGDVNTITSTAPRGAEAPAARAPGSDTPVAVLTYLARSMADDPDAVVIRREERRGSTVLRLHVAPTDMGRVIGRRGRTAQAIRTLVGAAGARDGIQTVVDIVDD
jgi:predicted RNA-binding protein YlqC (UPF0109 family)